MKNIIVLLAGLMMAGSAFADHHEGMNAEFRLRGQLLQNAGGADAGTSDQIEHRLVLGKNFKLNDKVSATATLIHNANWGSTVGIDGVSRTDADANNGLAVNEAYMTWQVSDQFSIKAGRGTYELGNGKVISTNDWQQVRTAFDGAAAVFETDLFRLTGFGVRFVDSDSNAIPAADEQANSVGASFDLKSLPDFLKSVNIHAIQNNTTPGVDLDLTDGNSNKQRETRYGVTVAGDIAGFDYDVTYAGMTGDANANDDVNASMIDAEFGFSLPDTLNLRFFAGYHMDSGDDNATDDEEETYDGFYYNRHDNAGLMDVVQWGNLTYFKLGASMDVMENLSLLVQYHVFTATEEAGVTATTIAAAAGADDEIGQEIDVRLTKSYDNGVTAAVRLGQFMMGDRYANSEDISELWFQTTVKF